jgi:hypothetical protein
MKKQRDDLKRQLSQPAPAADPHRHAHANCGNQPTTPHRNTKVKAQRIEKKPLAPDRIRKITSSFAFIEHRFLRQGFWSSLSHHELLLKTAKDMQTHDPATVHQLIAHSLGKKT